MSGEGLELMLRRAPEHLRLLVLDSASLASHLQPDELRLLAARRNLAVVVTISQSPPASSSPSGAGAVLGQLPDRWVTAADLVIHLYREDMLVAESLRPGEADISILKARHCPTRGPLSLLFQGHYARFIDHIPTDS